MTAADHSFTGPSFTIGIEEELMILDPETLDLTQGIERILAVAPAGSEAEIKPELLQSVLEIATPPCASVDEAGAELRRLRAQVAELAAGEELLIAAAGTHPYGCWEAQEVVDRPRYHKLVEEFQYIARRELIFGTHVHVGIEGANRAIYVADGIRRYLPLLLALSVNSPFWRGHETGLQSTRTVVFRGFPRLGVPPHYGTWEIFAHRLETMIRAGAIEDATYLWWDVRPHADLGTVETRIWDQQTDVRRTVAFAALLAALAHRMSALYDAEEPLVEFPSELIDDNKIRAAINGIGGSLVEFREGRQVPTPELTRSLLEELAGDAAELGCDGHFAVVEEILADGPEAARQLDTYRREGDLRSVAAELVIEKVDAPSAV